MRKGKSLQRCGFPRFVATLLLALNFAMLAAYADDEKAPEVLQSGPSEESAKLDLLLERLDTDRATVAYLESRLDSTEGIVRSVTQARLDKVSANLFSSILEMARLLVTLEEGDAVLDDHRLLIEADLARLPGQAFAAMDRISSRIGYPEKELETIDLVAADQRLFEAIRDVDAIYQLLIDYLSVVETLKIDVPAVRDEIAGRLSDATANLSVFLDMSRKASETLRASIAILPDNGDLPHRLSAADARVKLIASSMRNKVTLMRELDLDVRQYKQQILTSTGEITTEVLDVHVIAGLISRWTESLVQLLITQGPKLLFSLLLVIVIVYAFLRLSRLVESLINRGLDSSKLEISHLLRSMIVMTGRNLTIMIGFLIALSQIGISLGPLLAGLGIAGFIVGFAMQDSLSNFASGMLILLYRPFDVGDVVEAGGVQGKVRSMSLVNTTIMTFDNQALVVPNNLIWQTVIKNVTVQKTRRVDLVFGISYGDDIEHAERVFHEIVDKHEKVLAAPEPMIHLHELADSSVNFIVRPWVRTDDYWDVYWDITRSVKLRLDEEGISIPFPQRDVHVHEVKPA